MKEIIDFLQTSFEGDITNDPKEIENHSRDASLLEVIPELVIYPKNTVDVSSLVQNVNAWNQTHPEHLLHITARSGGTCMAGGAINTSIILDFTRYMNTIHEVTSEHGIVEPGCYYRDFEIETLKHGSIMPAYTASKMICAVGGMVGNNAAGEKTIKYGKVENYVTELEMVLADGSIITAKEVSYKEAKEKALLPTKEGQIYRDLIDLIEENYTILQEAKPKVSKNSAGYYLWNIYNKEKETFDLTKLFTGSQGTLGIVTKITFRLVPVEPYSNLLAIFMPDLSQLGNIVAEIIPFKPESIESYDDYSMKLAIRFWADFIKQMGLWGALKLGFSFLPEIGMILRGGVPKLILLVECGGHDKAEVKTQLDTIRQKVAHYGFEIRVARNAVEAEKYWKIRRESFNMLRKHVKNLRTAPFIEDLCVDPLHLPTFLPELEAILKEYKLDYTVAGHAGNGNFHIIPLMDLDSPFGGDMILEISDKVYTLVQKYGGSITAEHNDGIIRTPYLHMMYSKTVLDLFQKTKDIFDRNNIFNPGKKVGGSKEFIRTHIAKSHGEHEHKS